ncbi:protein serine/threonine phosphatase [Malassezia pachydermatis]
MTRRLGCASLAQAGGVLADRFWRCNGAATPILLSTKAFHTSVGAATEDLYHQIPAHESMHATLASASDRRSFRQQGNSETQRISYMFNAAAFGIPKERPSRKPSKESKSSKQHGFFKPLAHFLLGDKDPAPPKKEGEENEEGDTSVLPSSLSYLHGKGLTSTIRDHGRIVRTRLLSKQVGEDAYFLKADALGVADGVGGWASSPRADPALFSQLLMHFCKAELRQMDTECLQASLGDDRDALYRWMNCDLVEVMQAAWERCVRASKREGIMGSSTALLSMLRGDELHIANMGDCVLLLIRNGEMIFRSAEQQHSFNFPVQLGMMDATVESVTLARALCMHRDGMIPDGAQDQDLPDVNENMSGYIRSYAPQVSEDVPYDSPRHDAGYWVLQVQPGDLVIMATDGLFDNLFDDEISEVVQDVMHDLGLAWGSEDVDTNEDLPYLVSEQLCIKAYQNMHDFRVLASPFQQHANEEGIYYVGAKNDDVTVLSGVIRKRGEPSYDPLDAPSQGTSMV